MINHGTRGHHSAVRKYLKDFICVYGITMSYHTYNDVAVALPTDEEILAIADNAKIILWSSLTSEKKSDVKQKRKGEENPLRGYYKGSVSKSDGYPPMLMFKEMDLEVISKTKAQYTINLASLKPTASSVIKIGLPVDVKNELFRRTADATREMRLA